MATSHGQLVDEDLLVFLGQEVELLEDLPAVALGHQDDAHLCERAPARRRGAQGRHVGLPSVNEVIL